MTINKNNYEEYFLLLADNELSMQERNMVEAYIKEHPELEEEFLNICQSILSPGKDVTLFDKSSLYRHSERSIDLTNYQELFLLYTDNEATNPQKNEVEAFLLENPALRNELDVLRKSRLQPDSRIVFPDKNLLFRTAEGGKVVPFKWWKAVAAAVLLGLVLWSNMEVLKNDGGAATITVKSEQSAKPIDPVAIDPVTIDSVGAGKAVVVKDKKEAIDPLSIKPTVKKAVKQAGTVSIAANHPPLKAKTNDLPPLKSIAKKIEKERSAIALQEIAENDTDLAIQDVKSNGVGTNEIIPDEVTNIYAGKPENAITASYSENGTGENVKNDNYAFYNISEERFNKGKVGGFLRKVKRTLERKISPLNNARNQREVAVN